MTASELLTLGYTLMASSGLATEEGPNNTVFQIMAVVEDLDLCVARDDTVRYDYLLQIATNQFGDGL